MSDLKSIIHSHPEIHSGDPVFVGTRVPVRTLLDYIEGGDSLEVFLDNFPSVGREQAVAFLEEAGRLLANGNAIRETLYLLSLPGMRKSILVGAAEPLDSCSEALDW
jgi:uncharacterized protein (DUF433 family)